MLTVYWPPKYGKGKSALYFVGKVLIRQAVFYIGNQDTRAYVDSILVSKIRQGQNLDKSQPCLYAVDVERTCFMGLLY